VAARVDGIVPCEGEWDVSRRDEFARLADEGLASGEPVLILDFRPATFVDASTVGAICAFAGEASQHGVQVAVTCGEGPVRRVFDLVHLADAVPVAETVDDAKRLARARA
jgi:anti-anti-sigma factor